MCWPPILQLTVHKEYLSLVNSRQKVKPLLDLSLSKESLANKYVPIFGPPRTNFETTHFDGKVLCVFDGGSDEAKQDDMFDNACALRVEIDAMAAKARGPPIRFIEKAEFLSYGSYRDLSKKQTWNDLGDEAFHSRVEDRKVNVGDEIRRIDQARKEKEKARIEQASQNAKLKAENEELRAKNEESVKALEDYKESAAKALQEQKLALEAEHERKQRWIEEVDNIMGQEFAKMQMKEQEKALLVERSQRAEALVRALEGEKQQLQGRVEETERDRKAAADEMGKLQATHDEKTVKMVQEMKAQHAKKIAKEKALIEEKQRQLEEAEQKAAEAREEADLGITTKMAVEMDLYKKPMTIVDDVIKHDEAIKDALDNHDRFTVRTPGKPSI